MEISDDPQSIGHLYGPIMAITDDDSAREHFGALVRRHVRLHGSSEANAIETIKSNIGYWAGYRDPITMRRILELFNCVHPVLGDAAQSEALTPEDAFNLGARWAKEGDDMLHPQPEGDLGKPSHEMDHHCHRSDANAEETTEGQEPPEGHA